MGWFYAQPPRAQGFGDMLQVIKGFLFFYTQKLRKLSQVKTFPFQGLSNSLPYGYRFLHSTTLFVAIVNNKRKLSLRGAKRRGNLVRLLYFIRNDINV
jgi:hypothetical protein